MSKTAKQLIEEKVQEQGPYVDSMQEERKYVCMDTGLVFETRGGEATRSPFTGSENISEQEYMQMTDVPANQKDPMKQVPVSPNPVPSSPAAGPSGQPPDWQNAPWSPNPAPDVSGKVGADQADPRGFVPYPQTMAPSSTTTSKNATAGARTDQAPGGSK